MKYTRNMQSEIDTKINQKNKSRLIEEVTERRFSKIGVNLIY